MTPSLASKSLRTALSAAAAAFAFVLATPSHAQTSVTTGAAEVRAFLARASNNVYATAYGGGLYRSTDGSGGTWTRVALPANERYLTSIAGNDTLVVVGAEEGLLRSTDGLSFTRVLHEPVTAVAVAPLDSGVVLAAVKGVGILRSTNSGASFVLANNAGIDSLDMTAVVFHPSDGNVAYAASRPDGSGARGGVFRSTDGGATWSSHSGLPAGNNYVSSLTVAGNGTVYAGVLRPSDAAGDVYSRTATGTTWTASGAFFGVVSLHRDANASTTIWGGSRGLGLLVTNAGGSFNYAFDQNGQPNMMYTGINAVATLPGSAVVLKAVRGAGVWRSTASASPRSWSRVSFPGADRVLSATGAGSASAPMFAGLYAGGAWRSTDGGGSFSPPTVNGMVQADFAFATGATRVSPFTSIWDLASSATNGNVVYAAAGGVGMFYSNDESGLFRWNGSAWGAIGANATAGAPWNGFVEPGITIPFVQVYGVAVNPGDQESVYASFLGSNFGIYRRSGAAWSAVAMPSQTVTPQVRSIVTSATPSKLLALPFDDKAILSTNGGASFAPVSVSQTGFERVRFFSAAENPANGNQWVAGTNKGVFISGDGGFNWSRVTMAVPFTQLVVNAVGFNAAGRAFAADFEGNRYCSANGGQSWVSAGSPLRAGVNAIRTLGGNLYYLTDGAGMFREDGTC
jgi:hypothetical protein